MSRFEEQESKRILKIAEEISSCYRCGSRPIIDRDKNLGRISVKCPNCKDMRFPAILLDTAVRRWNLTVLQRTRANEIANHNQRIRALGAKQLPTSVEDAYALSSRRK